MNILIKSAKIIDPNSEFNGQTKDILIENGIVSKIDNSIENTNGFEVLENEDLHVSPGLFDLRCNLREPGLEQHEDLESGIKAAEKGGYTGLAILPSTEPVIDTKSMVDALKAKTSHLPVDIHPIGAATQKLEGKELSEMYDMHSAGAVAFSDDKQSISNPNLLSRALLYSKNFDGLIMNFPNEKSMSYKGQINEGQSSVNLGLEGIPALSEELVVSRDLFLANYNQSKLHIGPISTSNSVSMIQEAKEENINVSCDIAAHQIFFTDDSCSTFDSNFKVMPPFRSEEDNIDLIEGLKSGVIDVISSDHTPWDQEEKLKEFGLANFGITGLQTSFSICLTKLTEHIGLEGIIQKTSINPRTLLKLEVPIIKEGFSANFVAYNPNEKWTLKREDLASKSFNTPFIGTEFTGKVLRTLKH